MIDHQTHGHRRIFVPEQPDGLAGAVFIDLDIPLPQIRHQAALAVTDGGMQDHQIHIHGNPERFLAGLAHGGRYQAEAESGPRHKRLNPAILRLPHGVLHLLNDVAELDSRPSPSAAAASATAAATVIDTLRRSSICGSSDAPGWRTATRLETALAAARTCHR